MENWEIFTRLLTAVVLGGLIGFVIFWFFEEKFVRKLAEEIKPGKKSATDDN